MQGRGKKRRGCIIGSTVPNIVSLALLALYVGWMWTVPPSPLQLGYKDISTLSSDKHLPSSISPHDACNVDMILKEDGDINKVWKSIDDVVTSFPDVRVSGGIFLYPRQASLLTILTQHIVSQLMASRQNNRPITICETGFGSGHSLALFAEAVTTNNNNNNNIVHPLHLVSFDKFERPYQMKIWNLLNETYTKHHQVMDYSAGNSCKTVPDILSGRHEWNGPGVSTSITTKTSISCDILHGSSLCPRDNIDLVEHAPCGALLTSTAMGSLKDRAVYFGPKAQWRQLRDRGCITPPICFEEAALKLERNFVFAKEGSSHDSQFCIAMTTGRCRPRSPSTQKIGGDDQANEVASCETDLFEVVSKLQLNQYCPQYQVSAPL